ncbi:integrase, partial [Pseudomonas aeruginosa]|nr:integrase [Pseudomonas aeruginosa]
LFISERRGNVEDSTLRAIQSNCRTLSSLPGDLDIRTHTRTDMVTLKEKITDGRKPLTINKLLTQLSTVMDWAKNNGHIERAFDKGLKIERGAE